MSSKFIIELLDGKKYQTDILIVLLFAFMGILSLLLPEGNILRMMFGTIFVLFLPGYALVSALWPEAKNEISNNLNEMSDSSPKSLGISKIDRILLSIGLSLAIIPILGLLLDAKWVISKGPVVIAIFLFIVSFSIITIIRRQMIPENQRFHVSLIKLYQHRTTDSTKADKIVSIILVISLVIAFSILVNLMLTPKQMDTYTVLYVLDQNSTIENLPLNLGTNDTGNIIVGIICHEEGVTNYNVVIQIQNITGARQNRTIGNENFTCDTDEKIEFTQTFQIAETGEYRLEIFLFKGQETVPLKELHIWIDVN